MELLCIFRLSVSNGKLFVDVDFVISKEVPLDRPYFALKLIIYLKLQLL